MELNQLTNDIVKTSSDDFLVDYYGQGGVLIISFGFYDHARNPGFDFYGRSKKLELLSGHKINKILIRDKSSSWYHNGVPGLGTNADEMAAMLKDMITQMAPEKVITIGQSMGAYAAILYGALIDADKVIAFGPLSTFDPKKLKIMRDKRWLGEAERLFASPPPVFYEDLPELLRSKATSKTKFELFYGTKPGADDDRNEGVNYDAAHAIRFYDIPNVSFFPVNDSRHAVVQYLINCKLLNNLLLNRIFDKPFAPNDADAPMQSEWISWIRENIERGCKKRVLFDTLKQQGIGEEIAINAISRVISEIDLKSVL